MRIITRVTRVLALLALVIVIPIACVTVAARFMGSRIYLLNSTSCRVVVMEEHDGHGADPGDRVLVKTGFVDRTPTMFILAGASFLYGGLHFSIDKLQVRDHDDVLIPAAMLERSVLGSSLTYELTDRGMLVVKQPISQIGAVQPVGLPLVARSPLISVCARG